METVVDRPASKKRAAILLKAAMQALDSAGGSLPLSEIKREVEKRVQLTEHDRTVYEKSGSVRWETVLHFYSIDCVKAGFIRKSKGRWWLTPEGKAVLPLPPGEIMERANRAYRQWKAQQAVVVEELAEGSEGRATGELKAAERAFVFETAEAQAKEEI